MQKSEQVIGDTYGASKVRSEHSEVIGKVLLFLSLYFHFEYLKKPSLLLRLISLQNMSFIFLNTEKLLSLPINMLTQYV